MGTIYIGHFGQRIGNEDARGGTAQHYLGYAEPWRFESRVREHLSGRGAKITRYVVSKNIPIVFTPILRGADVSRETERKLKKSGHYDRLCPICRKLREDPSALDAPPF